MLEEQVIRFILACALGALIGLEREWGREKKRMAYLFGIRTAIITSALGYLLMTISELAFLAGLVFISIIGILAYIFRFEIMEYKGMTSLIAFITTYVIGALVTINMTFAAIVAIIVVSTLFFKRRLHAWVGTLTEDELRSAVEFLIIALVIFPLLPNKPIAFGINPFQFWYLVVSISAISFISFILLRRFSSRGMLYAGFFGGIINSAGTSYILAKLRKNISSGVYAATSASLLVNLVIVGIILKDFILFANVFIPNVLAAALLLGLSWTYSHRKSKINMESPFGIVPALKLSTIFFVLLLVLNVLKSYSPALFLLVLLASLYSSTAMIASLAVMHMQGLVPTQEATVLVLMATTVAILSKNIWVRNASPIDRKRIFNWTLVGSLVPLLFLVLIYLGLIPIVYSATL